jgi:hypothetical protein
VATKGYFPVITLIFFKRSMRGSIFITMEITKTVGGHPGAKLRNRNKKEEIAVCC